MSAASVCTSTIGRLSGSRGLFLAFELAATGHKDGLEGLIVAVDLDFGHSSKDLVPADQATKDGMFVVEMRA